MKNQKPILEDTSVLIPTLGRELLQEALSCIIRGSAWPAYIVVVDQRANPAVLSWVGGLCDLGIQGVYISSTQRGRAAGINRGLERIRTRFVVITDDDCFVDEAWLQTMVNSLRKAPDRIFTGRVEAAGDEPGALSIVASTVYRVYTHPEVKAQPLIGGNMGISMANVERIGPFDEHPSIHSAEDSDWGYRALRLSIPIVYDPSILVHHFTWRDAAQHRDRLRHYAFTQGAFYGKYLSNGDPIIILQTARDLFRAPIRWLRGILKHDSAVVASGRADTLYMLPGIFAGLCRRHTSDATQGWLRLEESKKNIGHPKDC